MQMTDQFAQSSAVLVFALGAAAVAEARSLQNRFSADSSSPSKEASDITAAPSQQDSGAQPKENMRVAIVKGTAVAIVGLAWLVLALCLIDAEIRCLRWLATEPRTTAEADALYVLRTITAGIWLLLAPPTLLAYGTAHAAVTSRGRSVRKRLRQRAKQALK